MLYYIGGTIILPLNSAGLEDGRMKILLRSNKTTNSSDCV